MLQHARSVNLMGGATDYNDGFVLPLALDCATHIIGRRVRGTVRVFVCLCLRECIHVAACWEGECVSECDCECECKCECECECECE